MAPAGDIYQAGTLSGNPLAVEAGIATLVILQRENTFNDISNQIGLVHQKVYLIELENLKRKYKMS